MTKDEMDILRKIANQLERIADALTGEHIEEKSLAELCETCESESCHGCMWGNRYKEKV